MGLGVGYCEPCGRVLLTKPCGCVLLTINSIRDSVLKQNFSTFVGSSAPTALMSLGVPAWLNFVHILSDATNEGIYPPHTGSRSAAAAEAVTVSDVSYIYQPITNSGAVCACDAPYLFYLATLMIIYTCWTAYLWKETAENADCAR
jgi:hypothetical protein